MKKVVLFKDESEEWAAAFGAAQYEPVFVPPLRFEPVPAGLARLAAALQAGAGAGAGGHAALVLTSPRAASALASAGPAALRAWRHKPLHCVGAATAAAAAALGLRCQDADAGAGAGSAAALAAAVLRQHPAGARFLFPCGDLRSETLVDALRAGGMEVEALTVYETKESDRLQNDLVELSRAEVAPRCMVFFSPSGCEYVHRRLQTFNNSLSFLPHFAIGDSTAHKIENLGVEPAGVAAAPRPRAMLDALAAYFDAQGGESLGPHS